MRPPYGAGPKPSLRFGFGPLIEALGARSKMELYADEYCALDNGEFLDFGFYDSTLIYGFGFSRIHGEERIEMIVADQSVYDLGPAKITYNQECFTIELPEGTIRETDGEDYYKITYEKLSPEEYLNNLEYLKQILEGNSNVELVQS